MTNIPFPRLLDSTTMQEVRRITPISASVNLNITPLSTATLVVDIDEDIPLRSYIEMYTTEGSAGIFRVREIQSEYGTRNIKTLSLEHAICELADIESVATGDADLENPVRWCLDRLFSLADLVSDYRYHWSAGTVEANDTIVYQLNTSKSSYLDDLMGFMEQIPDYMLDFDQTSIPWKVNIIARPSTVTAEGRLSRNVQSATVRMDDRDWINRVVVCSKDGEGNTRVFSKNDDDLIAQYGRVNRVEWMDDETTTTVINRFMSRTLDRYNKFTISVTIDAIDLAQITGESLDSFKIGKKFRLAIDNFVKEENITVISWDDVYNDPLNVSITLAEPPDKVSKILHKNDKDKVSKKKKA